MTRQQEARLVSDAVLAGQYVGRKFDGSEPLLRHVREEGGPSLCKKIKADAFSGDYGDPEDATCETCLRTARVSPSSCRNTRREEARHMRTRTLAIKWVGVPKEARPTIRKQLRELPGTDFLVCSEKGRDQEARKHIRESLWAFNADFIAAHARCDLDDNAVKALNAAQEKLCEGANELVFSLLRSFNRFAREAVRVDGHAHFLNTYDGHEHEIRIEAEPQAQYFYVYRRN